MKKRRVEEKLNDELKSLKNKFNVGYELIIKYLPNEIRYSQNGKPLSGEVIGNIIFIYEEQDEKALATLRHEFIENLLSPLIKDYIEIINNQNRLLTQILIKKKEDIVEKITRSFDKNLE